MFDTDRLTLSERGTLGYEVLTNLVLWLALLVGVAAAVLGLVGGDETFFRYILVPVDFARSILLLLLPVALLFSLFKRTRKVAGAMLYLAGSAWLIYLWLFVATSIRQNAGLGWLIVGVVVSVFSGGFGIFGVFAFLALSKLQVGPPLLVAVFVVLCRALSYVGKVLMVIRVKPAVFTAPPPPPVYHDPEQSEAARPQATIEVDDDDLLPLCRLYDDGAEDYFGAEEQIDIGLAASDEGNTPAALDAFKSAAELDPSHPWARYNYGIFLAFTGNHAAALQEYRELKSLDADLAKRLYVYIADAP